MRDRQLGANPSVYLQTYGCNGNTSERRDGYFSAWPGAKRLTTRNAAFFAAAAFLLGACGGQNNITTAAADVPADNPAAAALEIMTTASGAPKRAAGNWELKHLGGGGTVIGTQFLCVDSASEEKAPLFDQIAKNVNCSKYETTRVANGWTFDFSCGPEGMTANTKGSASGDFAASYRVDMTESDGSITLERIIEAKRLGDCPAGVAPGTLKDEEGRTIADITN